MSAVWQVEFLPGAARDLKKLGPDAQHAILRYLRERIATAADPRRFGHALTATKRASGATTSGTTAL